MNLVFDIDRDPRLTRGIIRRWWMRTYLETVIVCGVAAVVIAVLFGAHWLAVVAITILAAFVALLAFIFFNYRRQGLALLAKAGSPLWRYELSDDYLRESTALGNHELPWQRFSELMIYPEEWLLFIGPKANQQFVALPSDQLSDEIKAFIRDRIAQAGGKLLQQV